jgi:hypothetical protein
MTRKIPDRQRCAFAMQSRIYPVGLLSQVYYYLSKRQWVRVAGSPADRKSEASDQRTPWITVSPLRAGAQSARIGIVTPGRRCWCYWDLNVRIRRILRVRWVLELRVGDECRSEQNHRAQSYQRSAPIHGCAALRCAPSPAVNHTGLDRLARYRIHIAASALSLHA